MLVRSFIVFWLYSTLVMAQTPSTILLDGKVSVENHQIKNLNDPTDDLDAVNKRYVNELEVRVDQLEHILDSFLPSIKTLPITILNPYYVKSGGYDLFLGRLTLIDHGIVYSTTPNPTLEQGTIHYGGAIENESYNTYFDGLSPNTIYYIRAFISTNLGVFYGNEIEFVTDISAGTPYKGGYVFYVFQPNDNGYVSGEVHGLIAAPEDEGTYRWVSGNGSDFFNLPLTNFDDLGSDIGAGETNCELIQAYKNDNNLEASFDAIEAAANSNQGGYNDWYLPSIGELQLMKFVLFDNGITDFDTTPGGNSYYWSSSLMNNTIGAMAYNFLDTFCGCSFAETLNVRPIRTF